jgi:type VI secretion system ImpA family protein
MTSDGGTLDVDALLMAIPGSQPAGADLKHSPVYDKIKAARRAADDKHYGRSAHSDSDDKLTPDERAAAARQLWLSLQGLLTDALTRLSKDLQLAVWLLESETYLNGFRGADNALALIRRLLETYWDTIYPAIQDDDEPLALRVGVMEWINERLPGILKGIPLSSGVQKYSLAHYELADSATDEKSKAELAASGRPSSEQFAKAMSASSTAHLEAMAGSVDRCLAQVVQLEQVTDARLVVRTVTDGAERLVPLLSFGQVRKVLEDCQFQVGRALRTKKPTGVGSAALPAGAEPSIPSLGGDEIWNRALQLVMQGQLEGLHLAQHHIEAASSGRERFLRQLQLSELCIQAGMHAFAYPILDELGKIIDARELVTWEDADVIRRTWSGLASVCKPLVRLRPESVKREVEAQERLNALANEGRPDT